MRMIDAAQSCRRAALCTCMLLAAVASSCGGEDPKDQAAGAHGEHEGDEDDHEEGLVVLNEKQSQAAGIRTVQAAPGTLQHELQLNARVDSNRDRIAHVTPLLGGVVQSIAKGLGDRVQKGDVLVEIDSVALGEAVADYLKARAVAESAAETLQTTKELYEERLGTLQQVLQGGVAAAQTIFEKEEELQQKAIGTVRPFLEAQKALQEAKLAKERELTVLDAERTARLLELEVLLRRARIEEQAEKDRLLALQLTGEQIDQIAASPTRYGRLELRAPIDGVIVARSVSLNQQVESGTTLFEIHDLSSVWVLAAAYEKDLARIRVGQEALVEVLALPGVAFGGEVSVVDFRVSEKTRTAAVRIVVENRKVEAWPVDYPLRPGMFASAKLVVGDEQAPVLLPEKAIVHDGERSFVFVREDERTYRRRPVVVREGAGGQVAVLEGLEPGADVAVEGTFTLESIARSGELGGGHSH